jgi:hypothetical protein
MLAALLHHWELPLVCLSNHASPHIGQLLHQSDYSTSCLKTWHHPNTMHILATYLSNICKLMHSQ